MKRIPLRLLALTPLCAGALGLAPTVERVPGGPRGEPQSCDSELVEQVRIGTLTGAAEYSFSDVGSISIGADGTLYVSDMDLESIREFDSEGTIPRITWAEPSLHDVYGPDGRLLHCVVVPDDAELVASRGSVVWGIVRGVLAEEYVVRWRIE